MPAWTASDIPDQTGRVAVVTGANSGLGYETTLALARKGAQVIMGCRNPAKAEAAAQAVRAAVPGAQLTLLALDLASLASVRSFAAQVRERGPRLDLLINNAGVMAIPRAETAEGFEMQLGVNHLAHFALTGLLIEPIRATPGSRVVSVSSMAAMQGRIAFDDLHGGQSYTRYGAYSQSKLANLLFAFELQRRLAQAGSPTLSLAAHPGLSATELQDNTAQASGSLWERMVYPVMHATLSQSAAAGALPQLYAATAPDVQPGGYYGPRWQARGAPVAAQGPAAAYDEAAAARLWQVSEELTRVEFL